MRGNGTALDLTAAAQGFHRRENRNGAVHGLSYDDIAPLLARFAWAAGSESSESGFLGALLANPRRTTCSPEQRHDAMDMLATTAGQPDTVHPEYETAFAELERRAARGEFTLAQWRQEVHTLRQRCTAGRPVALWRRHVSLPA